MSILSPIQGLCAVWKKIAIAFHYNGENPKSKTWSVGIADKDPRKDDDGQHFSILLTVYSKVKNTSAKGKTMSKVEKSTKLKELSFSINNSNYISFLQAILLKHGLENYKVTEKKHFPFKYLPLKTKGLIIWRWSRRLWRKSHSQ
ncbi:hypothetical protein V8B97DRAFT_1917147 [Scleroderma yunnanense]